MPFAAIDLLEGKSDAYLKALSDGVMDALHACFGVAERDRFQVITEHKPGRLVYADYFDIAHSPDCVFVRITLGTGRSTELKQAFYARLAKNLEASPGLRPQDLFVVLTETGWDSWSFGNGVAQYVELPREQWK
jgi:4-oxalocrotonate tautomerase